MCCVPLDKGYLIDESNFVYIQPTKGMDVTKLVIPKCRGIVIECGYEAPNKNDELNNFVSHLKTEKKQTTYFRFEQVT